MLLLPPIQGSQEPLFSLFRACQGDENFYKTGIPLADQGHLSGEIVEHFFRYLDKPKDFSSFSETCKTIYVFSFKLCPYLFSCSNFHSTNYFDRNKIDFKASQPFFGGRMKNYFLNRSVFVNDSADALIKNQNGDSKALYINFMEACTQGIDSGNSNDIVLYTCQGGQLLIRLRGRCSNEIDTTKDILNLYEVVLVKVVNVMLSVRPTVMFHFEKQISDLKNQFFPNGHFSKFFSNYHTNGLAKIYAGIGNGSALWRQTFLRNFSEDVKWSAQRLSLLRGTAFNDELVEIGKNLDHLLRQRRVEIENEHARVLEQIGEVHSLQNTLGSGASSLVSSKLVFLESRRNDLVKQDESGNLIGGDLFQVNNKLQNLERMAYQEAFELHRLYQELLKPVEEGGEERRYKALYNLFIPKNKLF